MVKIGGGVLVNSYYCNIAIKQITSSKHCKTCKRTDKYIKKFAIGGLL